MGRSGVAWRALVGLLALVMAASVTAGCGGSAAASVAPAGDLPPSAPPSAPQLPPRPGAGPVEVVDVPAVPADPRVLARVRPPAGDAPTVALTFDDGPDPVWTPRVLALLRAGGDVATFCMIGRQAAQRPDLVRAVAAAGMRLCDHTQDHDEKLRARPPAVLDAEVTGARTVIRSAAGEPVGYYRSPGGGWSPAQVDLATAEGMQPLGWSVDPQDWRRPAAAVIVTRVQRAVRPGAIVLLHDGGGDRAQTVAALATLLAWLHAGHYRTVFPTP